MPSAAVAVGGVSAPVHAGIPAQGVSIPVHAGIPARGMSAPVHAGIHPPPAWTEFLRHTCENFTFPQLLLRTVTRIKRIVSARNVTSIKGDVNFLFILVHPQSCSYEAGVELRGF